MPDVHLFEEAHEAAFPGVVIMVVLSLGHVERPRHIQLRRHPPACRMGLRGLRRLRWGGGGGGGGRRRCWYVLLRGLQRAELGFALELKGRLRVLLLVLLRRSDLDVLALAVGLLVRRGRRGVMGFRRRMHRARVLVVIVVITVDEGSRAPATAAAPAGGARGGGTEAVEGACAGDCGAPPCTGVEVLAQAAEVMLRGRSVGSQPLRRISIYNG